MNIHEVNHAKGDKNRYCGPSAISIVTGMSTGEAARLLRHVSGKQSIKGTHDSWMRRAFAECGIMMRSVHVAEIPDPNVRYEGTRRIVRLRRSSERDHEPRPTLAQWLKDSTKLRTAGRVFLVSAGNHWQIISGRRFVCGRTIKIISITDKKAHRRARVSDVYELKANGAIITPKVAKKPSATSRVDPARRELAALEKKWGFKGKIERDGDIKDYVVPVCEVFPRGFSTMHHDWWETCSRVMDAIEDYEDCVDDDGNMSR